MIRVCASAFLVLLVATTRVLGEAGGELFEDVVAALEDRYYDADFRETELPRFVEQYRPLARATEGLTEQREVTHAFLSNIPATHLGLLSKASFQQIFNHLRNRPFPTVGFELVEYDGKQFAHNILEDGPADLAGLLRGDRIVSIDGVLAGDSARLDWRTDDAFLPDPPVRSCLVEDGDVVRLRVERRPGKYSFIDIEARPYSAFEAAKRSARIIRHAGKRIAYLHFWFIHMTGVCELLEEKLEGEFADCDALVLDLRGRGGSATVVPPFLDMLENADGLADKPLVALINGLTRSAKEVIAYEIRQREIGLLVGEKTAGAVIPASFAEVGKDTYLMFPSFTLGQYTRLIEGKGVRPHLFVAEARPYSAGHDPLLETGLRAAASMAEDRTARNSRIDRVPKRPAATAP